MKKKALVHGTLDSLYKFFADSASQEFEIVAILSEEPEKISVTQENRSLDVLNPNNLPKFLLEMLDGIIFTDEDKSAADFFLKQGLPPRKIIFWNENQGWGVSGKKNPDGTQIIYFCGLEFHILNQNDADFFNETRLRLQVQRQIKNLSPQLYPALLAQDFRQRIGKPLDFNNLRTFTEKLQWIKIFDATPLKSRLADKFLVRNWVADKIGEQYLIPLLGVWDDFDDIDFESLPNQFVLKCNHGCGMNILVRDKNSFDKQRAREKINAWLAFDYGAQRLLEIHYSRIKRKIIAEKFMANGDLPDLIDYKFWCFNGKPVIIQLQTDTTSVLKIDHFDLNWNLTNIERSDHPRSDNPEKIPPPKNFELMKRFAEILAENFAFVRVDFYEIDGKVYFGEMTFTPGAGNFYYKSAGTDEYFGNLLKLPRVTPLPSNLWKIYRVRQKFLHKIEFPVPKPPPDKKVIASLTSWTKKNFHRSFGN